MSKEKFQQGWREGANWQRARIREAYERAKDSDYHREQLEEYLRDDRVARGAGGAAMSDDARTDEPVDRAGVDAAVRRLRRALIDGGPPALNGADVVLALDELTDRPTPWAWWTANRTIDRLRAALSASRERERATAARAARLTEAGNDLADAVNSGWTDLHELHELKRAWREAVRGDAPAVCVHPELDGPCSGCATP